MLAPEFKFVLLFIINYKFLANIIVEVINVNTETIVLKLCKAVVPVPQDFCFSGFIFI